MKSDPVTTAILRETADRLINCGAPIPLIYRCNYEIDGKKYTINIEIQPLEPTIEQEIEEEESGRNYILKNSKIIDDKDEFTPHIHKGEK